MVEEGKRPIQTTGFKRRDRDFDPEIQEPNKKRVKDQMNIKASYGFW